MRGEIYRSTIWRTRLDNTTNWSIVTMGIALSTTFSSKEASALPLILIGMLLGIFLGLEARRYRYFNVWRARARFMETHLYAQILNGKRGADDESWRTILAQDYLHPRHHISFVRAAGRRIRRTYIWIIGIQTTAYFGKLAIHPEMAKPLLRIRRSRRYRAHSRLGGMHTRIAPAQPPWVDHFAGRARARDALYTLDGQAGRQFQDHRMDAFEGGAVGLASARHTALIARDSHTTWVWRHRFAPSRPGRNRRVHW
jgi:hypothetical protein